MSLMTRVESMDAQHSVYLRIWNRGNHINKSKRAAPCSHSTGLSLNIMGIFCFGNNIGKQLKIELVVVCQVIPVSASLCTFIFSLSLMI